MESLFQNKALLYSVIGASSAVIALALDLIPEMSEQFEIVHIPTDVSISPTSRSTPLVF